MSFTPEHILAPTHGNNADAKTVSLRVMNGREPTPGQLAELVHRFALHKMALANSLIGFLARDGALSDKSRFRFVSNSGLHTLMIWPEGGEESALEDLFVGVMANVAESYAPAAKYSVKAPSRSVATSKSLRTDRVLEDRSGTRQYPGALDWFNPDILFYRKPLLVSWYGKATRYGREDYMGQGGQKVGNFSGVNSKVIGGGTFNHTLWFDVYKPYVWFNGIRHKVVDSEGNPVRVMSAGVKRDAETNVLTLHVVSKDASLAVFAGPMRVNAKGGTVVVEKLFDIDYTVDGSGFYYTPDPSSSYHDDNPQWVGLLQPLYFNKSCTKLAGLVTAKEADATTDGGFRAVVKLITVDLEAQTTTLDASHVGVQTTTHSVVTGGLDASDRAVSSANFGWYKHMLERTGGVDTIHQDFETVTVETTYGAVDWDGDTMRLALVELTTKRVYSRNIDMAYSTTVNMIGTSSPLAAVGSWAVDGYYDGSSFSGFDANLFDIPIVPAPGSITPTQQIDVDFELLGSSSVTYASSVDVQTTWRVYLHGTGETLASRDSGLHRFSDFSFNNVVTMVKHQSAGRFVELGGVHYKPSSAALTPGGVHNIAHTATGSGSFTENITADYFWKVGVEGGDLRHGVVHVAELYETGTSQWMAAPVVPTYSTLSEDDFAATANGLWVPTQGLMGSAVGADGISFTYTGGDVVKQRKILGRLSAWKEDAEIATGVGNFAPRLNTQSGFGFGGQTSFSRIPVWDGLSDDTKDTTTTTTVARDQIPANRTFIDETGATAALFSNFRTLYIVGGQAANSCAFNRDGSIGYVAVGGFGGPTSPGESPPQFGSYEAKFIVDGEPVDAFAFDLGGTWTYGGAITDGALKLTKPDVMLVAGPLFIDNVPKDPQ